MFLTILNVVYSSLCHSYSVVSLMFSILHKVLPLGAEVGIAGVAAYYMTRLTQADPEDVVGVFGPEPGSPEFEKNPENAIRCIAHRGASLDAPENTLEAFKYCIERDCNFIELDVRSSRDGRLVLLHDQGLQRLSGSHITDIRTVDWETIKDIDIGAKHPNRHQFKEATLCLLEDAVDYLLENNAKMIIDVKGEDNQIRRRDPRIVGAMSYRPYCFSAQDYDAEQGPSNPRFGHNLALHVLLRALDAAHGASWRAAARWCGVDAVLLHKDIVSLSEVSYWRRARVRCCGWSVNRPLEKLYWRGVLRAGYLAGTLLGEPGGACRMKDSQGTEPPRREEIKEFE